MSTIKGLSDKQQGLLVALSQVLTFVGASSAGYGFATNSPFAQQIGIGLAMLGVLGHALKEAVGAKNVPDTLTAQDLESYLLKHKTDILSGVNELLNNHVSVPIPAENAPKPVIQTNVDKGIATTIPLVATKSVTLPNGSKYLGTNTSDFDIFHALNEQAKLSGQTLSSLTTARDTNNVITAISPIYS